jgi:formylglycine-generating enzyme required for sulfatase activity
MNALAPAVAVAVWLSVLPAQRAAAGAAHEQPQDRERQDMRWDQVDRYVSQITVRNGAWVLPAGVEVSGPQWRRALDRHRARQRKHHGIARRPEQIKRAFVEGFAFLFDRKLYDPAARRWRIEQFLDRGEREFGGYDQVILWQSYPRLGIDQRNQFDYYRDLPDGWDDVRRWVEVCHRRQVRLLLTYNPWDRHTRGSRRHLPDMLDALKATGADGVYLDTLGAVPAGWTEAVRRLGRPVFFESEGHPYDKRIGPMHSAWGQGFQVHPPCQVLNTRWLWPAHKTFLTHDRHSRDHWDELCCAWFNGCGVLVWEVVFGNDTPWVARDKALLRALKPLMTAFWRNFANARWQPLVASAHKDLKINRWPGDAGTVYTLCQTSPKPYRGPLFAARADRTYLDLVTGRPLAVRGGKVIGRVPARGIGGVLEVASVTAALRALLQKVCPGRLPRFVEVNTDRIRPAARADRTRRRPGRFAGTKPAQLPPGMVWVPSARFTMRIEHPWHGASCYDHSGWGKKGRVLDIRGFAIDRFPVTNAQFAAFLAASGYEPKDAKNFLKHWRRGRPPAGLEDHPAVYVGLEDARAYAKWAHKRLPTEAEWQYAAQGSDGRPWPWGSRRIAARLNATGRTAPVGSFRGDGSPFGVRDLCGHVWQWVDDTYTDRVHRFTVLKGGSFYRLPEQASKWYIHTGPLELTSHVKVPLLAPSIDRFSTVGFRCVMD